MRISYWSSDLCSSVLESVVRIEERLADGIFIRHRRDRGHLRDQPVAGDHPLHRIVDVGGIMVEGGKRAHHAAHDRHWVRVAAETAIEHGKLLMHHGVARDGVDEDRKSVVSGKSVSVSVALGGRGIRKKKKKKRKKRK